MQNVIVAPQVRDLEALAAQLSPWLRDRLSSADNVCLENLAYPFGAGQSHETILFDASWSAGGYRHRQGYAVRIKPTRHTVFPDDLFEQQFRVMQLMHAHGRVRVARPLWLETDASVLGAPFFVMEKLNGRVAVSIAEPP